MGRSEAGVNVLPPTVIGADGVRGSVRVAEKAGALTPVSVRSVWWTPRWNSNTFSVRPPLDSAHTHKHTTHWICQSKSRKAVSVFVIGHKGGNIVGVLERDVAGDDWRYGLRWWVMSGRVPW